MTRILIPILLVAASACQVQADGPGDFLRRINPARFFRPSQEITPPEELPRVSTDSVSPRTEKVALAAKTNRHTRTHTPRNSEQTKRLAAIRQELEARGLQPDRIDARLARAIRDPQGRRPAVRVQGGEAGAARVVEVRDNISARRSTMVEKLQENPNVNEKVVERLSSRRAVPVALGHETSRPGSESPDDVATSRDRSTARGELPAAAERRGVDSDRLRNRMQRAGMTAERIEGRLARITARAANHR